MKFWNKNSVNKNEEGQALMMIVLVIMIALTVGVAVASQALVSSRQALYEEESAQAYAAAEAGAEEALLFLETCTGINCIVQDVSGSIDDANYNYTINSANLLANNIYEVKLDKDEVIQIDITYDGEVVPAKLDNTDVTIYWWATEHPEGIDSGTEAAIEYTYLTENPAGTYLVSDKNAFDGMVSRGGSSSNNFTFISETNTSIGTDRTYKYFANSPTFTTGTEVQRLLRIRAWYNGTWVLVKLGPGKTFSNQGYEITSIGTANESKRTLKVTRTNPYLPSIFDYVLFSGADLSK